ncbi:hypothetical protein EBR66_05385 [bacterium]|nr:hypothetical protein [bacterium]
MRTFAQYHDPVRILGRRLWILGLLVLCALMLRAAYGAYQKQQESYEMRAVAEAELRNVTERKERLALVIDTLNSPQGKDAALRERFSLGKEGEQMLVIVDSEGQKPPPQGTTTEWSILRKALFHWW